MIETLTMYPAPKPDDGTNKVAWTPTKFLAKGEYDLVNISLIGFDPNSGWTFEQCEQAWQAALNEAAEEAKRLRWWNFIRRYRLGGIIAALQQRQGMG